MTRAMTSGSGVKSAVARSNRGREMPRAWAVDHSLSMNARVSTTASGSARAAPAKVDASARTRLTRSLPVMVPPRALACFSTLGRCLDAHVLQQCLRRPAVDLQAIGLLVGADQRARVHSCLAVDLGDGIAQGLQLDMDLLYALGRQLPDVAPWRAEVAAAHHAVAEVAHEQGVEVRHVVALEHHEILKRQECRAMGSGRCQDESLLIQGLRREFARHADH